MDYVALINMITYVSTEGRNLKMFLKKFYAIASDSYYVFTQKI